jgi:hypothetical protein
MESYILYQDKADNQYKVKDKLTGNVVFSNSDAVTSFNSVSNTMTANGGGMCGVKDGIYPINSPIFPQSFTGFIGESPHKTIIRSKIPEGTENAFRYWKGASSVPLEGFSLSNLKIELNNTNGNGTGNSEMAWISSGMKDCTFDNIWVKSFQEPNFESIGFFMDTAGNTNNNFNVRVVNSRFEGSCHGQDMLGCGNLIDCDFSHNLFINNTAQAIGIGASFRSSITNNIFDHTGNTIGYESLCTDNLVSDNICWYTSGIKLSSGWEQNAPHISRNNKCINNTLNYGSGGIQAAISIDDQISGNKFYRTSRDGIQGSFLRTVINNNIFTDTNWNNSSDRLLGNTTQARTGGIIAFNSNSNQMSKNEWNSFQNNIFLDSGVKFTVEGQSGQKDGFTNGVVIDTKYTNSIINNNRGNLGAQLLKNFGTTAP